MGASSIQMNSIPPRSSLTIRRNGGALHSLIRNDCHHYHSLVSGSELEQDLVERPSLSDFLTNMDQSMPRREKWGKLVRNLWRRIALQQNCCGHPGSIERG